MNQWGLDVFVGVFIGALFLLIFICWKLFPLFASRSDRYHSSSAGMLYQRIKFAVVVGGVLFIGSVFLAGYVFILIGRHSAHVAMAAQKQPTAQAGPVASSAPAHPSLRAPSD